MFSYYRLYFPRYPVLPSFAPVPFLSLSSAWNLFLSIPSSLIKLTIKLFAFPPVKSRFFLLAFCSRFLWFLFLRSLLFFCFCSEAFFETWKSTPRLSFLQHYNHQPHHVSVCLALITAVLLPSRNPAGLFSPVESWCCNSEVMWSEPRPAWSHECEKWERHTKNTSGNKIQSN